MEELAAVAKPDTPLAWYRKLIANKFDGSKFRQRVGRPRMDEEAEPLVVQMAKENPAGATIAFEAQGEETGRCQRFSEFETERMYHRVHGGRDTEGREGWGSCRWVKARNYCVGELWELLDRI